MSRRAGHLLALVLAVALSGGSCSASVGTDPTVTPAPVATRPGSGVTGAPSDGADAGGSVDAQVDGAGGATLRLTVDAIDVVTNCPGRAVSTQTPSLGYFVVLEVTASLDADPTEPGKPDVYVSLGAEKFRVTAPDGTVQEVSSTEASWACYEDGDLLPPFVATGETASGKLVLDSASEHGTVTYARDDAVGWTWAF